MPIIEQEPKFVKSQVDEMPVHDWSRVDAGIFHDFHHAWIEELKRALNQRLPSDYYALAEQITARFGPDVLALQELSGPAMQSSDSQEPPSVTGESGNEGAVALAPPDLEVTASTEVDYYRLKQKAVAVRHVSDDRVVAVIEIVSKANKANVTGLDAFLRKSAGLMHEGVHLLVLDLQPTTPRDPNGIHGAIWEYISGETDYRAPPAKPLTLVAYEVADATLAYVVPVAVGDTLRDMPLFLKIDGQIPAPLEHTYMRAFEFMPRRWRTVLDQTSI